MLRRLGGEDLTSARYSEVQPQETDGIWHSIDIWVGDGHSHRCVSRALGQRTQYYRGQAGVNGPGRKWTFRQPEYSGLDILALEFPSCHSLMSCPSFPASQVPEHHLQRAAQKDHVWVCRDLLPGHRDTALKPSPLPDAFLR